MIIRIHKLTIMYQLSNNLNPHVVKKKDLIQYEGEIKQLLEQDIVSRYYLQEGIIEASFDTDPDILKAVEILEDSEAYDGILKPN